MGKSFMQIKPPVVRKGENVDIYFGWDSETYEITSNDYHVQLFTTNRNRTIKDEVWKREGKIDSVSWGVRDYFDAPQEPGYYKIVFSWTMNEEVVAHYESLITVTS